MAMRRFDDAIAETRRAVELDPISPVVRDDAGGVYFWARRYDEAITIYNGSLTLDPNFPHTHFILALAYDAKGAHAEAIAASRRALQLDAGDPDGLRMLACALAHAGQRDEAVKVFEQMKTEAAHRYVPSADMALVYAALGDMDQAFAWLNKDLTENWTANSDIKDAPDFDDFRRDPRFADFLRKQAAELTAQRTQ
jgi:pentatricopeptide repeat protein